MPVPCLSSRFCPQILLCILGFVLPLRHSSLSPRGLTSVMGLTASANMLVHLFGCSPPPLARAPGVWGWVCPGHFCVPRVQPGASHTVGTKHIFDEQINRRQRCQSANLRSIWWGMIRWHLKNVLEAKSFPLFGPPFKCVCLGETFLERPS